MFQNILFDLDGTLADPRDGITRSIQFSLGRMEREIPSIDRAIYCVHDRRASDTDSVEAGRSALPGPDKRRKYMKIIDLTHLIEPGMPVYPGTESPVFSYPFNLDKDGFVETGISMMSHTGTHMDAPGHIIAGGITLDRMPVSMFHGQGICIDAASGQKVITAGDLAPYEAMMPAVDFVLFRTGWSRLWGNPGYFEGYPVLSREAAHRLNDFKLKGIGFDTISADAAGEMDLAIHQILLGTDRVILENLTRLEELPRTGFSIACFPLHFSGADGSPVRAVAFVD